MRVLVLGATGNLGSRLLLSLIAHGHQTVAFVRTASKVPSTISPKLTAIVTGDAKSQADIKIALLEHNCDAVVNTAGYAATAPWGKSDLPDIFQAAVNAAVEVGRERERPLRAWFLGGFGMLDTPNPKYTIFD
jgi:nucleoside-diphosphate-sugar epimerase